MPRVALVNMPFSNLGLPSIALTQLKASVDMALGEAGVETRVLYPSHDFAAYLGLELYNYLTNSGESMNTGLGEWFFRAVAFPEAPDNTEEYIRRYFASPALAVRKRCDQVLEKRAGLAVFLDKLIDQYELADSTVAGFTSMFMQQTASFAMSRRLKQLNPSLVTVMGGANCDYPMGPVIVRQVPQVDYVFSGPGLRSFPEFVKGITETPGFRPSIPGVFYKSAPPVQGRAVSGEELPIDTPLRLEYQPFLEAMDEKFPNESIEVALPFETSRGCWWGEKAHCTFCGLNGESMGYRAMRPDAAIEQFDFLFGHSSKVKKLEAVDNILPKNYIGEVLPKINPPEGVSIFYEVKADLSEADLAVLANSGVTRIQPGIEALATSTLKLMRKGTTSFQNIALLQNCALYGIAPIWNLLVGFPGETEETYKFYVELLPKLVHLPPPNGVFPVRFDRYSPYFTQAERYQLQLEPLDFYSLVYPFPKEEIKEMAYYFTDRNIQAAYFTDMAKWLGRMRAKVTNWHTRWVNEAVPPRLRMEGSIVIDTREGKRVSHPLNADQQRVLELLRKPKRVEDITKDLGTAADAALSSLERAALIFRENDRLLSLVLPVEHGSRKGHLPVADTPVTKPRAELLSINAAPAFSSRTDLPSTGGIARSGGCD